MTTATHHSVKRSSDFAAATGVATVPAEVTSRTTSLRRDDVTARSRDADADQWRVRTLAEPRPAAVQPAVQSVHVTTTRPRNDGDALSRLQQMLPDRWEGQRSVAPGSVYTGTLPGDF